MLIWILDYQGGEVLRINPLPKTRREIEQVYGGDVDKWLNDNEDFIEEQLGVRLSDCHYMVTAKNDYQDIRSIHF